jgi:phospholipid/cholesterol/gamma-HCH transport system substrate-binding protein
MENKKENSNIKLGIFVSIGIALFIVAIYFIGAKQNLFTRTISLSGMFTDVAGLQKGNNVRFSGINVGTIDDIVIISDSLVRVDMIVKKKVQKFIKKDAKATVGSEGLMGNKVINIIPGEGYIKNFVHDGDTIKTKALAGLDDIMIKMDSVAGNAVFITNDLKGMLANVHAGKGTLGKLFMDEGMGNAIDDVMTNVKTATGTLDKDLKALQSNFLFKKGIKKQEEEEKAKQDSIKAAKSGKTVKQIQKDAKNDAKDAKKEEDKK